MNSTSIILNRGVNPGGFLVVRCYISDVGKGQNLNPLVQIQASTESNYTSVLYNINQDSVEVHDLSWSLSSAKETLPNNTMFSKNDTIHFAVGIDANSMSTVSFFSAFPPLQSSLLGIYTNLIKIVVDSRNVVRLGFKGIERLTRFKVSDRASRLLAFWSLYFLESACLGLSNPLLPPLIQLALIFLVCKIKLLLLEI